MNSTGQKPLYPNMNFGAQFGFLQLVDERDAVGGGDQHDDTLDARFLELQDDRGEVFLALDELLVGHDLIACRLEPCHGTVAEADAVRVVLGHARRTW